MPCAANSAQPLQQMNLEPNALDQCQLVSLFANKHKLLHCRSGKGKVAAESCKSKEGPADGKQPVEGSNPAEGSAQGDVAEPPTVQEKAKRRYVKSGKFEGKFQTHQKQKEAKDSSQGRKRQRPGDLLFAAFATCLCLCTVSALTAPGVAWQQTLRCAKPKSHSCMWHSQAIASVPVTWHFCTAL